jgi:hypothetical protein
MVKTSGLSPYLGAGNVTFTYNMSGGLISFSGGLNFSQLIRTTRWGTFKLAYYWCPNSLLASNLKNFTLNKKDKSVLISWNTNSTETNTYEIEISTDGKNYSSIGNTSEASASSGSTAKYQYEYNPDQPINGTIFVRIKVTDAQGKVTYSEIRSIEMNKPTGEITQAIFPNPAINAVTIKSKELMQGDYEVALVNTIGQTVFNKTYRVDKTNSIKVEWAGKLNTGVYYLKVKDLQHQTQSISKLFIK